MDLDCKVCGIVCTSVATLSNHLRRKHSIKSEDYCATYYGRRGCVVCGNPTKFDNLRTGFRDTCSHKCGGIYHRRELSNDPERNAKFIDKTRANAFAYHSTITPEAKKIRVENIASGVNKRIASMCVDERKEKFGWLNKVDAERRAEWIEGITKVGAVAWWKNAPEEIRQEVLARRSEAVVKSFNRIREPFNPDDLVIENGVFESISEFFGI